MVSSPFKFERSTAYSVSSQMISKMLPEIHTMQRFNFLQTYNSFSNNLFSVYFDLRSFSSSSSSYGFFCGL